MCGAETSTTATAIDTADVGEQMARAACLVPSLWRATRDQQERGLRTLTEWAALEKHRPYPIEVVGQERASGSRRGGDRPE